MGSGIGPQGRRIVVSRQNGSIIRPSSEKIYTIIVKTIWTASHPAPRMRCWLGTRFRAVSSESCRSTLDRSPLSSALDSGCFRAKYRHDEVVGVTIQFPPGQRDLDVQRPPSVSADHPRMPYGLAHAEKVRFIHRRSQQVTERNLLRHFVLSVDRIFAWVARRGLSRFRRMTM